MLTCDVHRDRVRKRELLRYTLRTALVSVRKGQNVAGAQEVWGDMGGNSRSAQEDTGLLHKSSQSWFLSTLTLFFPWLFAGLAWTQSSTRAQEDTGVLDKRSLVWALNLLFSLGVASNFCLKQTSAQRQNKNVYPINYSIYQILCDGFQASISVMLYCTWLAPLI